MSEEEEGECNILGNGSRISYEINSVLKLVREIVQRKKINHLIKDILTDEKFTKIELEWYNNNRIFIVAISPIFHIKIAMDEYNTSILSKLQFSQINTKEEIKLNRLLKEDTPFKYEGKFYLQDNEDKFDIERRKEVMKILEKNLSESINKYKRSKSLDNFIKFRSLKMAVLDLKRPPKTWNEMRCIIDVNLTLETSAMVMKRRFGR